MNWPKFPPGESAKNDSFLTEIELAARWSVSVKKLQADRVKGLGPTFVKIGRSVRYRPSDVLAFEEAHLCGSTTAAPK